MSETDKDGELSENVNRYLDHPLKWKNIKTWQYVSQAHRYIFMLCATGIKKWQLHKTFSSLHLCAVFRQSCRDLRANGVVATSQNNSP